MFSRAILAIATFVPLVAAHGALKFAVVDGVRYNAPNPNGDSGEFAVRAVNDITPVKGTNNPALNCGHNAQKAALVADAQPGSTVEFAWANGEGGTWVHNTGPVMTYMASCGEGGCASFDSGNAQFFKIAEQGRKADGSWTMSELTTGPDATTKINLPSDLPAGEYLVRHELIGMHNGLSVGGAEFYPACFQIRLASPSRTAAELPSGDNVVTFPGGYGDSDPGIVDPNIYNPGETYVFPGPPIISSEALPVDPSSPPASSTSSEGSSDAPASTPIGAAPAPTPTSGSGCGNPSRKVKRVVKRIVRQGPLINTKKRSTTPVAAVHHKRAEQAGPHVLSRVMRGVKL